MVDVRDLTFYIEDEAEALDFCIEDNTESLDFCIEEYSSVTYPDYPGPYYVTPKVDPQLLPTYNRRMTDDVTVWGIPYTEVSNLEGITVIIGQE